MKILAIYGSPRRGGNTDVLLDEFVRGAKSAGAAVMRKYLRDMDFIPCIECGVCYSTGVCIYDDDYQELYGLLDEVDAMIISSPIFFYGVTAIVKAFIDRSQQFWVRKYKLKTVAAKKSGEMKKGYFLSAGATKGAKLFEGSLLTMKYFFDAIDFRFEDSFAFKGLERKGDAVTHEDILGECFLAGAKAAS